MIEDIKKWIEDFVSVHNETIGQSKAIRLGLVQNSILIIGKTGNAQRENQLCIRRKAYYNSKDEIEFYNNYDALVFYLMNADSWDDK